MFVLNYMQILEELLLQKLYVRRNHVQGCRRQAQRCIRLVYVAPALSLVCRTLVNVPGLVGSWAETGCRLDVAPVVLTIVREPEVSVWEELLLFFSLMQKALLKVLEQLRHPSVGRLLHVGRQSIRELLHSFALAEEDFALRALIFRRFVTHLIKLNPFKLFRLVKEQKSMAPFIEHTSLL